MARRKHSGADIVMDLVALLPWWAGVALAAGSYLVLHQLALMVRPATFQPGQMTDAMWRMLIPTLASVGQYVLPLLCLLGALVSFLRRRKRDAALDGVTRSASADALHAMSWREFEMLVGDAFRIQGYTVTEQGGARADGGVDLVLRKDNETFLVQCKQWKAFTVGVDVVRQLYGVMAAQGTAGGFVVTSGRFTAEARAFAGGRNVVLLDGPKLFAMIQKAQAARSAETAPAPLQQRPVGPAAASATPQCPVCASVMVRRTARKGTHAGTQFWGCSRYPECRGTR